MGLSIKSACKLLKTVGFAKNGVLKTAGFKDVAVTASTAHVKR